MIIHENPWLSSGETLICLGDSLTANPSGYMALLTARLSAQGITVVNAGRSGDKTPWALTRLQRDVLDRKPDAVSIFLGTNDAAIGRGKWADEPRVSPETYATNLRWMLFLCRQAGIEKCSITPPLWRFEGAAYAEFGDIMRDYCLAAREAADDLRARFVPADIAVADAWARHPGHTGLLLTTDGVHLSPDGQTLLVDTMLAAWGM